MKKRRESETEREKERWGERGMEEWMNEERGMEEVVVTLNRRYINPRNERRDRGEIEEGGLTAWNVTKYAPMETSAMLMIIQTNVGRRRQIGRRQSFITSRQQQRQRMTKDEQPSFRI